MVRLEDLQTGTRIRGLTPEGVTAGRHRRTTVGRVQHVDGTRYRWGYVHAPPRRPRGPVAVRAGHPPP